jgi:hypothetical protein
LHYHLPPGVGPVVLGCLCVAALLKGGWEERVVAIGLAVNVALTVALRDTHWPRVQWAGFALDLGLFALILAVALRSSKFWPLWAAAFALLNTVTHLAAAADRKIDAWAYLTAIIIWTYALMISLTLGVRNNARAKRHAEGAAPDGATRR